MLKANVPTLSRCLVAFFSDVKCRDKHLFTAISVPVNLSLLLFLLCYLPTMRFTTFVVKTALLASTFLGAAEAQDQCNLLSVLIQTLPLKTLKNPAQTICEKYTPAGQSQYQFISDLINLAFTGKYKPLPNLWPAVPNGTYQASGILDPNAVYRDPCYTVTPINLVPYFNGTWKSNNRHGVISKTPSQPFKKPPS